MEDIASFGKVFVESLFNPFGVMAKTEKLNKYNMFIDAFIKSTQNFFNELNNYLEHNQIVSNDFKIKIVLFQDEINAYRSMCIRYSNYVSDKGTAVLAANSKSVIK